MNEKYVGERLAKLREAKGVSAREMSLSIGQSANYINKIENQKAYPSMEAFFYICKYLGVTPRDFFDETARRSRRGLEKAGRAGACPPVGHCKGIDWKKVGTFHSPRNVPALPAHSRAKHMQKGHPEPASVQGGLDRLAIRLTSG